MALQFLLIFAIISSAAFAQTSIPLGTFVNYTEPDEDYSYIVSLKLYVEEDRVPELMSMLLFASNSDKNYSLRSFNVTTADFIDVISPAIASYSDLTKIILSDIHLNWSKLMNSNINTWPYIERLIHFLEISPGRSYQNLKIFIGNSNNLRYMLDAVNVNWSDLSEAIAFGTDADILKVLSGGLYTPTNLLSAMQSINKTFTGDDLQEIFNPIPFSAFLSKVRDSFTLEEVMAELGKIGMTESDLTNIFNNKNITAGNFYNVQSFRQLLAELDVFINQNKSVGVVIAPRDVIAHVNTTHLGYYHNPKVANFQKFLTLVVESIDHNKHEVKDVHLRDKYALIVSEENLDVRQVTVAEDYDETFLYNCTLIGITDGDSLRTELLAKVYVDRENNVLVANKSAGTLFNVGNPIICYEQLYGLATEECEDQIKFITFSLGVPVGGDGGDGGDAGDLEENQESAGVLKCDPFYALFVALMTLNLLM